MKLYDDQKEWCRATVAAFERPLEDAPDDKPHRHTKGTGPFTRVMGVAATGAGKTIMAAAITEYAIKRWRNPDGGKPKILFLADSDELINQAQEKIFAFTSRPTDREKAELRASLESDIVVGSMQTLQNPARRERFPANHFKLVIVDEAHQSMADTWKATMEYFNAGGGNVLGITATPERGDERDLWQWWEHQSAEIGLFDLIGKGRLSKIVVKTLPVNLDCRGVKKTKEGLDDKELSAALEPAFEAIIEAWEQHGEERKTLWFLPGVPASKRFAEMLLERGHASRHIDGKSPDRKEILAGFADNRFRHLTNANLLIKGYDCPDIACVVNLAPGKSRVAYQQKVGRGTRIAPGKENLLLLDFLWQFDRLGLVRPSDLVARTKSEAERIQRQLEQAARESDRGMNESFSAMDIHDTRDIADNQMVKALLNSLIANTTRKTRTYDASTAAALLDAPQLINYEPQTRWERGKPTDVQVEILAKKGIKPGTIRTRGEAARFLDTLYSRQQQGLATFKQAARLTVAGVAEAAHMTFAEATAAMDCLVRTGSPFPQP